MQNTQTEKTTREKLVDELAAQVFLAAFSENEETLDKIIQRINGDGHVPYDLKAEVYTRCMRCLEQMMINVAKQFPEGRPLKAAEEEKDG